MRGTPLSPSSAMETVQERELQEWQRRAFWPFDTVACRSLDSSNSSNGCRVLFEWDPQLRGCFGSLGVVDAAGDSGDHLITVENELELFFPKCMGSPDSSESPATVIAEDPLDELLRNFWDADEQRFNSSCILREESADCSYLADDDPLAMSSGSPARTPLPEETLAEPQRAEQLHPSSSSSPSRCTVEPQASDAAAGGNC